MIHRWDIHAIHSFFFTYVRRVPRETIHSDLISKWQTFIPFLFGVVSPTCLMSQLTALGYIMGSIFILRGDMHTLYNVKPLPKKRVPFQKELYEEVGKERELYVVLWVLPICHAKYRLSHSSHELSLTYWWLQLYSFSLQGGITSTLPRLATKSC